VAKPRLFRFGRRTPRIPFMTTLVSDGGLPYARTAGFAICKNVPLHPFAPRSGFKELIYLYDFASFSIQPA
jgi:hypothetical protein